MKEFLSTLYEYADSSSKRNLFTVSGLSELKRQLGECGSLFTSVIRTYVEDLLKSFGESCFKYCTASRVNRLNEKK